MENGPLSFERAPKARVLYGGPPKLLFSTFWGGILNNSEFYKKLMFNTFTRNVLVFLHIF